MSIGILNNCWAVYEIAHEIGKRQLPCLGCYQVMLGCDPPEGMRRKNPPDGIPQQRDAIPAAAESRLSENAEMASDELVVLKSCGRHQMNFGVIQMRADLRGFQILAADRQERGPAGLRNVIENVVFRKQRRLSVSEYRYYQLEDHARSTDHSTANEGSRDLPELGESGIDLKFSAKSADLGVCAYSLPYSH